MGLLQILQNEMKQALKAKDNLKLSVIRMLISEIKKVQIDKKKELSDEEIIEVIQRYAKQRKEAIKQYKDAKREDLAQKEEQELEIVSKFLPKQLSEEEIVKIVEQVIKETGASSMRDMGKVMKMVMEKVKGRADGSLVSKIVKEKLSN
ncbi:MAG TPA: GatB/YqeY domain-containing protein [Hydrogenothermaceae bacterium]|nr:GatB/YqeY domain-containing protein [Hydrogenothermaceae bacterium]